MGLKISEVTWVFIITVFGISFIKDKGSVPVETYLLGVCIAAMMELVTIPLFGHLSDRVGRRPIYLLGAAVSAVMAFPLFELLQSGQSWVVIATIVVAMNLGHGLMFAPLAALIPELFETRIRYSGSFFAYQMASALGGGGAPVIATALMVWSGGGVWGPAGSAAVPVAARAHRARPPGRTQRRAASGGSGAGSLGGRSRLAELTAQCTAFTIAEPEGHTPRIPIFTRSPARSSLTSTAGTKRMSKN